MGFLDNLGPAPGSATVKAATKTAAPVRAKASTAGLRDGLGGIPRTASRAKKKKDQMMIYIGGGLAAAVLVVILLAVAISARAVESQRGSA